MTNNKKMEAYGLDEHFTNFRPGAAPALDASMAAAYEKGEAWLGYYWGPTPLLGSYPMIHSRNRSLRRNAGMATAAAPFPRRSSTSP